MRRQAPERGFDTAEYSARVSNAQAATASMDMACLFLTTEAEIRYFTGFQTPFWQSPTRPWFLVLPSEGSPIAVIPEIGAALMRETWVEDILTWPAPQPADDGISLLAEALSPFVARGRIGMPMGHETHLRMPLGDWERLVQALPGMRLTDATALMQGLRMVKSEAEIAKIAHICSIASDTFAAVPEMLRMGLPREDLFRAFRTEALARGADEVPYLVGGAGPGGYSDVISPPVGTPLREGDLVMLDTGMTWDGYFCDFDRNWSLGPSDDRVARAYQTLWRATEAGLAAAVPGATMADLHHAMIGALGQGEGDIGRLGHGLGMQLTEPPSIAPFDQTVLRPGMVLTLEPSLSLGDGRMIVSEENIVVRDGPPELLSHRAPPELPIVAI